MLLSAEHISKNYGMKTLLEDVSIYLSAGERVGVIGVNGTGKSTLLRVLSGTEFPDEGSVTLDPGVQVSFLSQNPDLSPEATALEQVFLGIPAEFRALQEYEARTMLTRLGIPDLEQKVGTLSGGQRKRVALATALIHPADVLILDEPTNHLDAFMVEWLEDWLGRFKGGLLMVTHDRYFLERVCNRIAEVDRGKLYFYEANYSKYLELRQQRYDYAAAAERKRQTILRREYQWIIRGPQARGTKSKDRIRRYEELRDMDGPASAEKTRMAAASSRLGKKTVELTAVEKSFDGRTVLRPFSYRFLRDDRIGVVGRNGAGKTTLLNLIAGTVQPDGGTVELGETVKIGYFSQEGRELDLSERPYDYIHEIAPSIRTAEGTLSATVMLERFLFDGDLQYTTIGALSGGERRRLYLLGVLMAAPNVLLLDEPTNDLDIETLTILEEYLMDFDGIVVAVSHDRYFLDKVARQIFAVEPDGTVNRYTGGYTDYLEKRRETEQTTDRPGKKEPKARKPAQKKLRFSYKEQREWETIEDDITALEEAVAALDRDMEAAATDYAALTELTARRETAEATLEEKMERWVYLSELAERIEAQGT